MRVEVVAVDVLLPQAHPDFPEVDDDLHLLDVRDAPAWTALLREVDVVCHQAAMVGAGLTPADLPLYAGHNDLGTAALLAAMHAAGVGRLVLASSMVVYGEGRYRCPEHGPTVPGPRAVEALEAGDVENHCPRCHAVLVWELVDEDAALDPRSSYAASKLAQEHYAAAWSRQAGGRVVSLRYHNVYGPRMPRNTPYAGVASIFRSALARGEAPRVFEDGGQMRDFVHVEDVARANLAALQLVTSGEDPAVAAYNVCSGRPVSLREVADILGRTSGIDPVVTGEFRLGDVRHVVASPAKAARDLGFVAQVGPEEGLARFVHEPLRGG